AKLEAIKGHIFLVDTLARLRRSALWPGVYAIWAGDGPLRGPLESALREADLLDHVRLVGHRWDMASLYDAADLLLMTSYAEGMSVAAMEAMAKGVVPVCTAVGGMAEAIGEAGILLPKPGDRKVVSAAAAAAITALAEAPDRRAALSNAARQRALDLF